MELLLLLILGLLLCGMGTMRVRFGLRGKPRAFLLATRRAHTPATTLGDGGNGAGGRRLCFVDDLHILEGVARMGWSAFVIKIGMPVTHPEPIIDNVRFPRP